MFQNENISKNSGSKREVIIEQVHSVMGLKAFELGEVLPLNPCGVNNGNCSHFCFNRPSDFICDCPIGKLMNKFIFCINICSSKINTILINIQVWNWPRIIKRVSNLRLFYYTLEMIKLDGSVSKILTIMLYYP